MKIKKDLSGLDSFIQEVEDEINQGLIDAAHKAVDTQETTVFQPISDEQYREYRKLCYLRPIRAKNYLLDLVNFDGTPYNRGDFQFIGKDDEPTKAMIALWQEIEKNLFNRDNQHT